MITSDTPPVGRNRAVLVLLTLLAANAIGHSFVLIVLPPLGRQMGFGDLRTGMLVGLSALVLTVSGPAWGHACEKWGRRPVLLTGLAAAALFPALFAVIVVAHSSSALVAALAFVLLLAARLLQAAASGGVMPAAQAYLADSTSSEGRAAGMGLMGAAFGVGTVAGAALAWRLGGAHAVVALVGVAVLIFVATMVAWRLLPEPRHETVAGDGGTVRFGDIWPFLLITLCGLATYSQLQQVTALRFQDAFGLSPEESIGRSGATMMLTMAVMIVTQGLVVRHLGWGPSRLLRVGAAGGVLAMLAATFAPSALFLMIASAGLGGFLGLLLPGNLASLSLRAGTGVQAKAAGLNAIGQGLGMAVGPVLGAGLHQVSPSAPYGAGAVLLFVVCVLVFRPFAR